MKEKIEISYSNSQFLCIYFFEGGGGGKIAVFIKFVMHWKNSWFYSIWTIVLYFDVQFVERDIKERGKNWTIF